MDNIDFGKLIKEKVEEAYEERGHANVLIAGRTGVGKSTLINTIFQGNLAKTGQGRPVTENTRESPKRASRYRSSTPEGWRWPISRARWALSRSSSPIDARSPTRRGTSTSRGCGPTQAGATASLAFRAVLGLDGEAEMGVAL